VLAFLRAQWWWALLAPVLMLLGTSLHEGAHALMAVVLGGTVSHVALLPSFGEEGFRFGSTTMSGGGESAGALVALAPFLAAHLHALAGALIIPRLKPPLARVLFFTSVLLPLFDISMLHGGLFAQSTSADLSRFQAHALPFALLGWPALWGLSILAWRAFRSQWPPPLTLSRSQFAALLVALLAAPWLRFVSGLTH
jgi:hypothetical protein